MGEQVLTLGELSQRANLPKSTVHRLVEQLRAIGWLERDHSNGYRVGMRLFELGGLAMQRNQLRDTAFPHLHALATTTGLAVQLGVLDRGEVVYLERIVLGGFTLPTRLGGRMPAYCTGLGKAMLAFDDAAADEVMASALPRRTDSHDHRACRAAGQPRSGPLARAWPATCNESYDGLVCVAAPIRNSGRAIAAVSVTGPAQPHGLGGHDRGGQETAASIWNARFGSSGTGRRNADTPADDRAVDAATPRRRDVTARLRCGDDRLAPRSVGHADGANLSTGGHGLAGGRVGHAGVMTKTRRPRSSGRATSAPT